MIKKRSLYIRGGQRIRPGPSCPNKTIAKQCEWGDEGDKVLDQAIALKG